MASLFVFKKGEYMFCLIKRIFNKLFDYDIVGEYYDMNGDGHYYKKYIKKYHLKIRKD